MDRITGDIQYTGDILFSGDVTLPASCVSKDKIPAAAGVEYTKLQQMVRRNHAQSGTVASATIPIHLAYGVTGGALFIKAGTIVACIGAATITIDLKKNGTSVLVGGTPITLDNANTARVVEAGTLVASPTHVAGDFYELVIVATAGGGTIGTGLLVDVGFYEDPA